MRKIKVGILGAGRIAGGFDDPKHLTANKAFTHLGAYRLQGGFDVTYIFDLYEEPAKKMAETWNIPRVFYGTVDKVLKEEVDVISICTPDDKHFEYLVKVLEGSSAKLIFIEKPVAQKLTEIEQLIELSKKTNKQVVVNYQRQFDPKIQKFFKDEKSELLLGRACYYKGLSHIGSTMLDFILRYIGLPERVLTFQKNQNKQIEEDSYDFVLYYPNGQHVVVSSLDKGQEKYYYHIFDLELFYGNKRVAFNYNTRNLTTVQVGKYDYSDVLILNELTPKMEKTEYDKSMINAAQYIFNSFEDRSIGSKDDSLTHSYNIRILVDLVIRSWELQQTLKIEVSSWKS